MKTLLINSVYKTGSTGNIVYSLHNYFKNNNVTSFVIYGRGNKQKEDKNVFRLSNTFLSRINVIRSKITGNVYGGNYISTYRILSKIKRIKPDIVHLHNNNDQYVNSFILLKYLAKHHINTIITLHSEQYFTGGCGYTLSCDKYKCGGCANCPHLYLSLNTHIDKTSKTFNKLNKMYSLFDIDKLRFTAVSPWLRDNAKESILLSKFNVEVIPNGIDNLIFYKRDNIDELKNKYKLSIHKKIILFVSPRLADPVKGYANLKDIVNKLDNNKYQLVVVGDTTNVDIYDNVTYLGKISLKSSLAELYSISDLTILLSLRETFSLIIGEALMCGCKVLSTNCGGPEGLYNKDYVTFSCIEDFTSNIEKIINKKVDIDITNQLSLDKVNSSYLSTYLNIINNK